jgi:transposase InsO family protein
VKRAFIDAEKAQHSVSDLCRALGISRSGYYAAKARPLSRRTREDARLAALVVSAFRVGRGAYGSPRVLRELRERGERVSRKRVARLMRERRLFGRIRRRWRSFAATIEAGHAEPNYLERRFDVDGPNRAWATDISYVRTWEGWLYLAVVIDLFSRRVVGWAIRDHLRTELVAEALVTAIGHRVPEPGLLHHSDQGSQYGSEDYRRLLAAHGIACSMSRRGNCWDNAVVESFFATLKRELLYRRSWPTRDEATASIHEWIENFYNRERRHSYLGFRSPDDYEKLYELRRAPAA